MIYLFLHFGHEEELGQGAFAFHYQMNIDKKNNDEAYNR